MRDPLGPRAHGRDVLDRSGYRLEFDEDFAGQALDPSRWIAHYLPHWTTPERSAARYVYTPAGGLVEAVLRASRDPSCMLAFWLVGFEAESPEASGEICVVELFGHAIGPDRSHARIGVKAHHDPRLRDDMEDVALAIDAAADCTPTARSGRRSGSASSSTTG